jgi:carboxymethylenebutenolidase
MPTTQPPGFLALPPSGNGRAVLVLHAWWGLNDTIKSVCTRLAALGYTAFAADLYHGKVAKTIPEAEELGGQVDANHVKAEAEVADAARFLRERAAQDGAGLAVLAFSMGGYYAVQQSTLDPDIRSVVLFYGTPGTMPLDYGRSRASYLGHFAGNDQYETPAIVDGVEAALKAAGRPVNFYRYSGVGHWFFEPDRPDAYNKPAADLAWERTVAYLNPA